mmetsp:Transcript_5007/g.6915  ORF Transcript_5007/g.6915 Transcript_5007/m.6915 type:complete len:214 (+) Transcript_5007:374-1015(+)
MQFRNLLKDFNDIMDDPFGMNSSILDSGEINQMVSSIKSCMTSVPVTERQKLAEAAMSLIRLFVSYGNNAEKARLVAVPDLLSSLASLCKEESILKNSTEMNELISNSVNNLSYRSSSRTLALVEAGWADLLVKTLLATPDDDVAVWLICSSIYLMLNENHTASKIPFVAAGAVSALEDILKIYSTPSREEDDGRVVISMLKSYCTKALILLI